MRKKLCFISAICSLFIVTSCYQDDVATGNLGEGESQQGLAVEFVSKKQVEMSNEFINSIDYADFISPEIQQLISESSVYTRSGALTRSSLRTRSGEEEVSTDTLYYSEQIPLCEEIFEDSKIYFNGEMESVYETNVDPEGNPILVFYEDPFDLEQVIARVEVKEGQRKCYSKNGTLLSSEPCEQPDMKEFVQELQYYVEQVEQEGLTRGASKRNAEWLRAQMASQPMTTRSGRAAYYDVQELPNGNVILVQEVVDEDASVYTRGLSSGRLLTRTELSPDISRTIGYELRSDEMLLERRRYKYSETNPKTRSQYAPQADGTDVNPEEIISERLVFTGDGTPMIEVKTETYSQNQTIFHFNKK